MTNVTGNLLSCSLTECASRLSREQAKIDLIAEKLDDASAGRTKLAGAASQASLRSMRLRAAQVRRTLVALLRHFGIDDGEILDRRMKSVDGNWLFKLHRRLFEEVIPPAFSRVYRTMDEVQLRAVAPADAALVDAYTATGFEQLRKRGLIPQLMANGAAQLLLHPLTHGISFGIPNGQARPLSTTSASLRPFILRSCLLPLPRPSYLPNHHHPAPSYQTKLSPSSLATRPSSSAERAPATGRLCSSFAGWTCLLTTPRLQRPITSTVSSSRSSRTCAPVTASASFQTLTRRSAPPASASALSSSCGQITPRQRARLASRKCGTLTA